LLKYEEKLHWDKQYEKLQSSSFLHTFSMFAWGIVEYTLLYYLIKYLLGFVPDFRPWHVFPVWFSFIGVEFSKIDLPYFTYGLILSCYGMVKLSQATQQNHKAKSKDDKRSPITLVTDGYYAKVRHPMYGTFVILQAGLMLSLRSSIGMAIALLIAIFQYINAVFEEKKQLIPIFKETYGLYKKQVRHMILPLPEIIMLAAAMVFSIIGFMF
jgi:protein-S-isoprenylcysteine O-methyltransferase Ste14